jgi:DegV family protein with EDD domain
MTVKILKPEIVHRMLILAYQKVADKKEAINSINMFPVPDQDTGDNLVNTLKGVYDAIYGYSFTDITKLRDLAIDGAICNASGNVGIIVTGFLNGFLSHLPNTNITNDDFCQAFSFGMVAAYESIQNPKEGTILDVIKGASESLTDSSKEDDLKDILKTAIKKAKDSLNATQFKMDIYQKTATVDAGGYGFLLMLEGFLGGLNGKYHNFTINKKSLLKPTSFLQVISHRYEVISLIQFPKITKEKITDNLIPFGDCLDIVQANTKIKIHIHTDLPDEVVNLISKYGTVIFCKTTDMTKQVEENDKHKESVGIVVDSATSLPQDFIIDNNIAVVSFKTSWEKVDQDSSFKDIDFYQKMLLFKDKIQQYGYPKTSQPSPQKYLNAFKEQLQKFQSVICITMSDGMSGSYNCALQARSFLPLSEQNKILIPDFQQIGPGQAILADEAVKLIKKGYTIQQIEKKLLSVAPQIKVIGTFNDVSWVVKGGRVSGKKVKIINFLQKFNFHPTFCLNDKKPKLMKIYFGHKPIYKLFYKNLNQIAQNTENNNLPLTIVLQHNTNSADIEKLKTMLDPKLFKVIQTAILAPVTGIHTGPGSISAGILINNP